MNSAPSWEEIGRGLKHAWFPVAAVEELATPQPAVLLETQLVVFRDVSGNPAVLDRRCPHRGGDLALGQVIDDAIECPYHGWRYSGADGRCTLIPSLGEDGAVPSNAKVRRYPVVERIGLVWTCLETPMVDPPVFPELDALGMEYLVGKPYYTDAGMLHALENFRDVAHFSFVHRKSMGDVAAEVGPIKVDVNGLETRFEYDFTASGNGNADLYDLQRVHMSYRAVMPSVATNLVDHGPGGHRAVIEAFCPASAKGGCRIFLVSGTARDYTASTPCEALEAEHVVVDEDMVILDSVLPLGEVPLHGEAPTVSVPADRYTMTTRRTWLSFVEQALRHAEDAKPVVAKTTAG
jgi:phenylpropionate dioxygenase-like ring-hydroxylating dioxygenase large terminal subunit